MDDYLSNRALQDQLRFLRSILLKTRDCFWVVDRSGRIVDVNEAYLQLSGYSREELLRKKIADLTTMEQPHETENHMQRIIDRGSERFETRHRCKDGRVIDIDLSVTHLDIDRGYFVCFCRDISERKQTEREYRALFQEMIDGFARHEIICDQNGKPVDYRFLAVNPAFEKLTGLAASDLLGKTVREILPHIEPAWIERYGRVALSGEAVHFEEYTAEIGKHFEVRAFCPAPNQFACTFVDITERKQSEAERHRLAMAIDQVGEVIVMTDVTGKIQFVNPAFEAVTGYSFEAVVGQNPRLLKSGVQDDAFYQTLWETISSGKTWYGRMVNKRRDGTFYTEDATISPVMDESGAIINYVSVMRDISPLLDMEKRLIQAEKLEAIGALAGGIAHDFNNILSPIIGFSELLLDDLKGDEPRLSKVREIYTGAKRAADLVQQILAFGRQTDVNRHSVDVLELVREVLSLARSVIPNHFGIEGDLGSESCFVHADSTQLHQMVMNLIINAYHSMQEKDSGVIKVTVSQHQIDETTRTVHPLPSGKYVALRVSDTGTGIDPEDAERIFEPYFTTKSPGRGSGLGLAIVHSLVREYGGDILLESEKGAGSTFTLLLPRLDGAGLEPEVARMDRPGGGEHIMIVDDESAIVRMETIVLERLGYRVSGFSLSVEGLQAFQAEPQRFDLVITDMAMPVMTGLQLAEEMLKIRPDLPILICTGFSEQLDKNRMESVGIKGLLLKPLLRHDLAAAVRKHLDEALRARIRGRILIVDDESSVRNLFREKLAGEHCEVLEAANGAQGLNVCRRERVDLVVCDLIMPDKEGIETIMDIRREFPKLPIVAISGGGRSSRSETYLSMAERLGACHSFTKPIHWDKFFKNVVPLLQRESGNDLY